MPFSPEQADRICRLLTEERLTLRQIAERENISDSLIIWNARHDDNFAKQYARAMEIRTERDFESLEDELLTPPKEFEGRVDNGWVQWKRVQLDTRKWALSKRNPKRYSEKLQQEISGPEGGPVQQSVSVTFVKPPDTPKE